MTHSVMFYHFHNDFHMPAQGSLSHDDFREMLAWLGKRFNILNAKNYMEKFFTGDLKKNDICLSFVGDRGVKE